MLAPFVAVHGEGMKSAILAVTDSGGQVKIFGEGGKGTAALSISDTGGVLSVLGKDMKGAAVLATDETGGFLTVGGKGGWINHTIAYEEGLISFFISWRQNGCWINVFNNNKQDIVKIDVTDTLKAKVPMRNIARNHHYVPQFYLRGFLDPNLQSERLHIIDKIDRRHFVSTPRRVARERDFNRINIPDHAMDEIESHLAQIEAQAATVLRDIAQNATLPQNRAMDILVVFVGILAANNPQIRDSLINIDQEITRQMMQSMVESRESYESRLSELGLEDQIGYDVARAFVESGNYTISIEDQDGYYLARVF